MKILIEEHQYPASLVDQYLKGISNLRDVEGMVSVNYVGYFYNPEIGDCVFILPKVLIEYNADVKAETVFGHRPEAIIDPESKDTDGNFLLKEEERSFIYELSVWIYRAIVVFNESNTDNHIVYRQNVQQMSKGRLQRCSTFLDILLALLKFHRDNREFFFFTLRNIHSGYNKINWTRTLSNSQAIVQGDAPVYVNPVNKKRQVNFDEELIVIFLSILQHISNEYGFYFHNEFGYELIRGAQFKRYIKKTEGGLCYGCTRLRQIKYKYFSDKALYLWELCYAFFERSSHINVQTDDLEYLLVKDFNIVFEAIIDELVGDKFKESGDPAMRKMDRLKNQPDGKIVDHLYRYDSLTHTNGSEGKVWYIGDSKYYKKHTPIGENSEYKQFTYARNVIQWSMNVFLEDGTWPAGIQLRDEVTEGYNILPNFFISARQETLERDPAITKCKTDNKIRNQRQFENRLFDRDTLLVCHYDVNFLYVVALYAQNNPRAKRDWQQYVRKEFMKAVREELEAKYDFYAMTSRTDDNGESYIQSNFQKVSGKLFRPYGNDAYYALALDKNDSTNENTALVKELEAHFFITKRIQLGIDPSGDLEKMVQEAGGQRHAGKQASGQALVIIDASPDRIEKFKQVSHVGVGLQQTGKVLQLVEGFTNVEYLITSNKREYSLRAVEKGPILVSGATLPENTAVTKQGCDLYILYTIDDSIQIVTAELDINKIKALCKQGTTEAYPIKVVPIESLL